MSGLAIRAEIEKLERLCRVGSGCFAYLKPVPAPQIRRLREAVQDSLFGGRDAVLFKRLALAGALLPLPLVAMMAEKIFGPMLGARVAGEMSTRRAVALAAKLPIKFLADVSVELDPARARDILHELPPEQIRDVALELVSRGEFVTMGRFVGYLTHAAIRLTTQSFKDPGDLLRVAFYIEDKPRLDEVVALMSDARLLDVMHAAQADPDGLWAEAVALMGDVSDTLKRKLGDLVAGQPPEVLAGLVQTAHRQHLWDDVMPVVAHMSEAAQRHISTVPELCEHDIMCGILVAVDKHQLWDALLPLIDYMGSAQLKTLAWVATDDLPVAALGRALTVANRGGKWDAILTLAEEMTPKQLAHIGQAADALPKNAVPGLLLMADERGLWRAFLPIAAGLSDTLRAQVAQLASMATPAMRERIIDAARSSPEELWPAFLRIVALIPADQRAAYADVVARHARAEPGLVERLAPAAQAQGLGDLLGIARRAITSS
ncbi:MAG TPA: hypothetical protein VFQ88_05245 [Nevskiaceae bacterium]|nr:hypothetical protein [Nevskiaceae bacterium]